MEKCAFDFDERRCSALTKKSCNGCHFYKTKAQVLEGRKRSEARLDALPGGLLIFKKYYCGEGGFRSN